MDAHRFATLRRSLRHIGAASLVGLGALLELGWSFVGSMGLGLRPGGPAGPLEAAAWVGVVVLIAAAAAISAFLALPDRSGME